MLRAGLIAPANETTHCELAPEHTAEPLKSLDDITRISKYLIANGRYRDNMLFIVGINFGLRVSDLRMLRFSNLINDSFIFKDSFPVFEKKTRNTRTRKKNRYITINTAVIEAVTLYLEHTPNVHLSDYLIYLKQGEDFDPRAYLEEFVFRGEPIDISRSVPADIVVEIDNEVRTNVPGVYEVTYILSRSLNTMTHSGIARLIVIVQ